MSDIAYKGRAQGGALVVHDGSSATIRDAKLGAANIRVGGQSPVTIEDSEFELIVANTRRLGRSGGPATIRGNRTRGILFNGSVLVEGNELVGSDEYPESPVGSGIDVEAGKGWTIRDLKHEKRDAFVSASMMLLLSGVILAGAAGTLHVMGLKLNSDIVALTACQTGLGKHVSGEGIMGMGRAFQYAGARAVLMTLWSVSEDSSVQLVETFFEQLKRGKNKLEAMRLAERRSETRGLITRSSGRRSSLWER